MAKSSRFDAFGELAVAGVRGLQPYVPGKPISEVQREYGVHDVIKLASNENPLGPSPRVQAVLRDAISEIARYPDGAGYECRQAIAKQLDVDAEQIALGNGSNDILELIARCFVASGDEVIFSQYAFAVYAISTQAVAGKAVQVAAKDWGHDLHGMLAAISDKTRLIYIANPNNPTGTWLGRDELYDFIRGVPERIPVVIDEAYLEYARDPSHGLADFPDASCWLGEFPNLIVTRTFSKAYALAGLRVGYSVSHPSIAALINRVRQPFNVNLLAQYAACAALEDHAHLQQGVQLNANGLQQLYRGFEALGLNYIPSAGNFVCVDLGRPAAPINEGLLRAGVIVRPVANYGMPNHLRISVGLTEENQRLLDALGAVLADN